MTGSLRGPFARHLGWNAVGTIIPAAAALWAVTQYTRVLGADGFALLALVWVVVGWLSLADLGLSRALTQGVARALGNTDFERASATTWSAMVILAPVVVVLAAAVAAFAPRIALLLHVDAARLDDAAAAIRWASLAFPVTVLMTAWRGVLEGARAFGTVAMLRVPFGVAFALVPLWMATPNGSVAVAVQGIVIVRTIAMVAHAVAAHRRVPALARPRFLGQRDWRDLATFGGWTTVVNALGSVLNGIDRIGLGALIPLTALAPYALASEVIMKVWLLAAVIVPVQYAWFASLLGTDGASAVRHYASGIRLIAVVGFGLLAAIILGADSGMTWWVGASLGGEGATALRWMAVGVMANLPAQVAQALVQAAGRPSYTAWGYLIELPLMVAALALVVPRFGATGAALVWSARFVVDSVWCLVATERVVPEVRTVRRTVWGWCLGPTVVLAALAAMMNS